MADAQHRRHPFDARARDDARARRARDARVPQCGAPHRDRGGRRCPGRAAQDASARTGVGARCTSAARAQLAERPRGAAVFGRARVRALVVGRRSAPSVDRRRDRVSPCGAGRLQPGVPGHPRAVRGARGLVRRDPRRVGGRRRRPVAGLANHRAGAAEPRGRRRGRHHRAGRHRRRRRCRSSVPRPGAAPLPRVRGRGGSRVQGLDAAGRAHPPSFGRSGHRARTAAALHRDTARQPRPTGRARHHRRRRPAAGRDRACRAGPTRTWSRRTVCPPSCGRASRLGPVSSAASAPRAPLAPTFFDTRTPDLVVRRQSHVAQIWELPIVTPNGCPVWAVTAALRRARAASWRTLLPRRRIAPAIDPERDALARRARRRRRDSTISAGSPSSPRCTAPARPAPTSPTARSPCSANPAASTWPRLLGYELRPSITGRRCAPSGPAPSSRPLVSTTCQCLSASSH